MRKILLLVAFSLLLVVGAAFAQNNKTPKYSIGLDSPFFGWVTTNEQGGVQSMFGLNMGLGVSYRSYFQPLMPESGSAYWEAGTFIIIDPYVGAGYDYRVNEEFYVGGGVDIFPLNFVLGAAYLGPYAAYLSIVPNVHLGFFLF